MSPTSPAGRSGRREASARSTASTRCRDGSLATRRRSTWPPCRRPGRIPGVDSDRFGRYLRPKCGPRRVPPRCSKERSTVAHQLSGEVCMSDFPALGHVALTVTDLGRSRPWYEKLFGTKPVIDSDEGTFHHVVWLIGGGTIIGIHQFPDPSNEGPFNERRVGLDHVAFGCANRAELETW